MKKFYIITALTTILALSTVNNNCPANAIKCKEFSGKNTNSAGNMAAMTNTNPNSNTKGNANIEVRQSKGTVTHVTITCYQPVRSQCAGNPLITSDGSKIDLNKLKRKQIRWCAVSRDLLYLFPKDKPKRIKIEGRTGLNGIWEVKDVTNKRFKHRVDILIHPQDKTRFKHNNVKIIILK